MVAWNWTCTELGICFAWMRLKRPPYCWDKPRNMVGLRSMSWCFSLLSPSTLCPDEVMYVVQVCVCVWFSCDSMYLYMSVYACRVCPNSFLHFGRIWVGRQQAGPKFHVLRLVIIFLFSKTWWDRILEEGRSSKVPLRFHAFSLTNLQNQHQIDISQLRHEVVSVLVAAYVINWNLGEKRSPEVVDNGKTLLVSGDPGDPKSIDIYIYF